MLTKMVINQAIFGVVVDSTTWSIRWGYTRHTIGLAVSHTAPI